MIKAGGSDTNVDDKKKKGVTRNKEKIKKIIKIKRVIDSWEAKTGRGDVWSQIELLVFIGWS